MNCTSSSDCDGGKFCDVDESEFGFCEYCPQFENGTCEGSVMSQRGEGDSRTSKLGAEECKARCDYEG